MYTKTIFQRVSADRINLFDDIDKMVQFTSAHHEGCNTPLFLTSEMDENEEPALSPDCFFL